MQNLMNDHAMDHDNVWIVDDNARSLHYSSDPFRRTAAKANQQQQLQAPHDDDDDEMDSSGSNDGRIQMQVRGPQRSDSAIPSGVERSSRRSWSLLRRRSVGTEYKAPRNTSYSIEPQRRKWTVNKDSSLLCCPVRRESHDTISVYDDLHSLEFDSSEFNSGEFSLDSIVEDPFGTSSSEQ